MCVLLKILTYTCVNMCITAVRADLGRVSGADQQNEQEEKEATDGDQVPRAIPDGENDDHHSRNDQRNTQESEKLKIFRYRHI